MEKMTSAAPPETVVRIKALLDGGHSCAEISRIIGISAESVRNIDLGNTHKNIPWADGIGVREVERRNAICATARFLSCRDSAEGGDLRSAGKECEATAEEEHWVAIDGTGGRYEVSDLGRVRRVRDRFGRRCSFILRPHSNTIVYPTVHLSLGSPSKRKRVTVHRLVAASFIPNPGNLPQVNHRDENPRNNRADNLEWCSEVYNHNYGTYRERNMMRYANPILFEGVRYNSIHDCARKTGRTCKHISQHSERITA